MANPEQICKSNNKKNSKSSGGNSSFNQSSTSGGGNAENIFLGTKYTKNIPSEPVLIYFDDKMMKALNLKNEKTT